MDLADLLLILLFVVLPLVQHLMDRRSSPEQAPPLDPEEEAVGLPMDPQEEPLRLPRSQPEAWETDARLETAETLSGREVVDEEEAAELMVLQERLPAEILPEAVRVSSPVVSLEPLEVERPSRSLRPSERVLSAPARGRRRGVSGLDSLLHSPGQLRRAIVLSEVLGPPKGLE